MNRNLVDFFEQKRVDFWLVPLDPALSPHLDFSLLSETERLQAKRFVKKQDTDRYSIAHTALRHILAHYTGHSPAAISFTCNEFGKPRLVGSPKIDFNLSHSANLALIAVSNAGRIGVDVELIRGDVLESAVAERFFSKGELRRLQTVTGTEWVRAFFRCWTRKEAYLKAIGCGISDEDLATVEVTLLADEEPEILRRVARDDSASQWSVIHLEPEPGYVGAIVVEGADRKAHFRNWPREIIR